MDSEKLRRFVEIDNRIKQGEAEVEDLKKERLRLQAALLDEFADDGIENVRIDGRTVYAHRMLWAKAIDKDAALKVLREHYPEFISESFTQALSSLLRERERAGDDPIPPELAGLIDATEAWSLRSRRA